MKKLLLLFVFSCTISLMNAQTVRWGTRSFSPTGNTEEVKAIAADSIGNTYITGSFQDTAYFGSTFLYSRGLKDIFVAKVNSSGDFVWAKSYGSTGTDEGYGITVDYSGNIFVTGYFANTLRITPTDSLITLGGFDAFILKLDNTGNLLMKISEGSATNDYGRGIAVNYANGNFAMIGDQQNNLYYHVKKYYPNGTYYFQKLFAASSGSVTGTGICFDNTDRLYTCGYYTGNLQESPATSMINSGGQDGFYLVYTPSGTTFDDYKGYGGTGTYSAQSIYSNLAGTEIYVCGSFNQSNWTIGYDSWSSPVVLTGGSTRGFIEKLKRPTSAITTEWAKQSTSISVTYYSVTADRYKNAFVTAQNSATYKYNEYGALVWTSTPTGTITSVFNNSVSTDKNGNAYVAGRFTSSNITFGDSVFTGTIGQTAFVEKISSVRVTSPSPGTNFCVSNGSGGGDSVMVNIVPTSPYNAGNVFTIQMDNNSNGAFTTPVTIGTLPGTGSGTVRCYIPSGTSAFNIYIRVISSSPVSTVGDLTYLYTLDKPIVSITPTNAIRCPTTFAPPVTLTGSDSNPLTSGFGSYSWMPGGSVGTSVNVYPTVATSYTLSITDGGCTGKDTVLVNVHPMVTVSAGTDQIICRGTNDTLHATGTNIATYAWTPSATLTGANTANPISTPTSSSYSYTCTVTSPEGCTTSDYVAITSPQTTANAGPISYNTCLGGAVPLTGTSTGIYGRSYNWTPATGLSDPNISNPVATPVVTTMYKLVATDTVNGCQGKDSINIIVGPVAVSANDLTITCANSGTLTATATGNYVTPLTYSWSPAANLSSTTTSSVTANPIANTTYFVTVTTGNGCSGSDSSNVTVLSPNYNVNFSAVQQLFTAPPFAAQFNNTTPSMSSYTFTWLWGDGTSTVSSGSTVFHVYSYNGTYDVTLIAVNNTTGCSDTLFQPGYIFCTGGTGCSLTSTVSTPQGTSTCMGDTLLLTANTGSGYNYQWNMNGSAISGATASSYNATVQGNYSVTINDGSCSVVSSPVSLSFLTPPTPPSITHTGSITTCGGGTVYLTASAGYASYHWNTGATTQNITVTSSGVYTVAVTTGSSSCNSSASYSLNASSMAPPEICVVGVDSASGKNIVIWNPPVSNEIDSFLVYKEGIVTGQFNQIGAVDYNSFSTFLDNASNPAMQAERYKIAVRDTCGVVTLMSSHHKTIHLTINAGAGSTWNLIWNHYEGFTYGTYNIYRGTTPSNLTLLTSLASSNSSFTDLSPPAGLLYYQIEAINPTGCNPTTRATNYSATRSNIVDDGLLPTGIDGYIMQNGLFTLYPNPATDILNIVFASGNGTNVKMVEMLDIAGRIVLTKQFTAGGSGDIARINIAELRQGIYFVRVKDEKSEGMQRLVIAK